jgi:hypothetical protein
MRENFSRKASAALAIRAPARFQVQSLTKKNKKIVNKMRTIAAVNDEGDAPGLNAVTHEAARRVPRPRPPQTVGTTFGDSV